MAYKNEELLAIWAKGKEVESYDARYFRKDIFGAWMIYGMYGNHTTRYGWDVKHNDGDDSIQNSEPMQWENKQANENGEAKCVVTSKGADNIRVD